MAAGDKAGPRPTLPYLPQLADQGRGDMVSENRAANDRFKRNSKVLQQQQPERSVSTPPGRSEPEQGTKKELSFGADRQPNRQNHGQLKQEHSASASKDQGQQAGAKKELTFGPGRGQGQGQEQDQSRGR